MPQAGGWFGGPLTVVLAVAVLFDVLESVSFPITLAVLVMVPP